MRLSVPAYPMFHVFAVAVLMALLPAADCTANLWFLPPVAADCTVNLWFLPPVAADCTVNLWFLPPVVADCTVNLWFLPPVAADCSVNLWFLPPVAADCTVNLWFLPPVAADCTANLWFLPPVAADCSVNLWFLPPVAADCTANLWFLPSVATDCTANLWFLPPVATDCSVNLWFLPPVAADCSVNLWFLPPVAADCTANLWFLPPVAADNQKMDDDVPTSALPSQLYPSVGFQVLNLDHLLLSQTLEPASNASLKVKKQSFLFTGGAGAGAGAGLGPGAGLLQPAVNASYGPLSVDAPVPPELLLGDRRIQAVLLSQHVRSSAPVVRILFHLPPGVSTATAAPGGGGGGGGAEARANREAYCVTAYAYWETREVRGACLVPAGGYCLAQLKPEPAWFGSASRSASSSKEQGGGRGGGGRGGAGDAARGGSQGNRAEVYFKSRVDRGGQCAPQDSLRRMGAAQGPVPGGSGTPMSRIGSVNLLRTPPGNPTFLRLRLGGSLVVQTSSKPLKMSDVATFYVFLSSASPLESFTLR
ncbi:unnamed protein product [Boreogadus saida]